MESILSLTVLCLPELPGRRAGATLSRTLVHILFWSIANHPYSSWLYPT